MKKGYCDITLLVDKSASMSRLKSDVIGGVNGFIKDQKKVGDEAKMTLIQFATKPEVVYTGKNINEVKQLTDKTYIPNGASTALYDAIASTAELMGNRFSEMAEEDRPEKVIFLIQTDGLENDSKEYDGRPDLISEMLTHQQEKYSWEVVFLGANINAKNVASTIGIRASNAMSFAANDLGTKSAFDSLSRNVALYRCGSKIDMSYETDDYAEQLKAGVNQ